MYLSHTWFYNYIWLLINFWSFRRFDKFAPLAIAFILFHLNCHRFADAVNYSGKKSSYVLRISGSFQVSDRLSQRILAGKLVSRIVGPSFQRHVNRKLSRKKESYFGQTPPLGSNRPNSDNCDVRVEKLPLR